MPDYTLLPNTGQSLGQTRDTIKTNFNSLQETIVVDHEDITDSNYGKHKQVTLTETSTDPTVGANEIAIYNKLESAKSMPYVRYENNGIVARLREVVAYGAIKVTSGTVSLSSFDNYLIDTVTQASATITISFNNNLLDNGYLLLFGEVESSTNKIDVLCEVNQSSRSVSEFNVRVSRNGVLQSLSNLTTLNLPFTVIGKYA